MTGTAVIDTAWALLLPEPEIYLDNILDIDKVTSLLAGAITIVFAKEAHLVLSLPLVIHLENHGSHFALVVFLRTINVEIAQAYYLALGSGQQATQIIIKEKLGEGIHVQRFLAGGLFTEAMGATAIGGSGGSIHHLNFSIQAEMQHILGVLKIVFHHVFAVVFHGVGASALVENNVNFFMIEFACLQSIHKGIFIHVIMNLQALNILEFYHIGQVINHQNIINTAVIKALNNITADKAGTTSYNNHNLPSLTILAIFSTTPVVE